MTGNGRGQVTGLGGVFWRAKDPEALAAWYAEVLGVTLGGPNPQAAGLCVPAAFAAESDYWPTDRRFMLNLRVDGLDELIARLQARGIKVDRRAEWDSPETGRFARITDPDGTPVELWEPPGAG
jgi:predicted enzyme related to lactoylglutathione lyase